MSCVQVHMFDKFHCILLTISFHKSVFARAWCTIQNQQAATTIALNCFFELLDFLLVDHQLVHCIWRILIGP